MNTSKRLINVKELAEILNVPVSWIYQRTRLGTEALPHIRIGKYVRFDVDQVLAFLQAQTKSGTNNNNGL